MKIRQFAWDVVDSNSWLITEETHGLLIDAVDSEELYAAVKELSDLTVILTHAHFDHIIGLEKIRELCPGCHVVATKLCSEHICNRNRNMSSAATAFMAFYKKGGPPVQIEPFVCSPADEAFENGLEFDWYGNRVALYAVYGHTNDGLIAIINDEHLFSGDTLLHIPTATRFPTGSKELLMSKDIPLLKGLNAETVYPGHGRIGSRAEMLK